MKDRLIKAASDIREANGLAQTAINGLSGNPAIPSSVYDGMYATLLQIQDPLSGLEAQAKKLDAIIAETPDDEAQ